MNIKFYRIIVVIKRHIWQMQKDVGRMFDMVYWPMVDIVLWGFTSMWLEKTGTQSSGSFILLAALVMWSVIWRSQVDISLSFLEELWSENLVNLVATPLTFTEWVLGVMLLGVARSLLVFFYTAFLVWLFFGKSIFVLGLPLYWYVFNLIVAGWALGFFVAGFLAYYGKRIQSFVWAIGWLFSILGAVFYPVSVLPHALQLVCKAFPLMYVFETMRMQVQTGLVVIDNLIIALVLSVIYCLLALTFFAFMFKKSAQYGLARLEID